MSALVVKRDTDNVLVDIPGDPDGFMRFLARSVLVLGHDAIQQMVEARRQRPVVKPAEQSEVMSADEVAEFLGVDRNTVYDYAGRGVIPHQRLGKRILFRRGALLSWLEGCKATSTRKG